MSNIYLFAQYVARREALIAELQLAAIQGALSKPGVVVELKQKLKCWMELQLELKKAS
jgi:hypothetical protein